jgi:hypothetical protein
VAAEPHPHRDASAPIDDEVLVGCRCVETRGVLDGLGLDAGHVVAHPIEQPVPRVRFQFARARVGIDKGPGVVLGDLDQTRRCGQSVVARLPPVDECRERGSEAAPRAEETHLLLGHGDRWMRHDSCERRGGPGAGGEHHGVGAVGRAVTRDLDAGARLFDAGDSLRASDERAVGHRGVFERVECRVRVDASRIALHERAPVESQTGKRLRGRDRIQPLVRHPGRVAAAGNLLEFLGEPRVDAADRPDERRADGRVELVPHPERPACQLDVHGIAVRETDDALSTMRRAASVVCLEAIDRDDTEPGARQPPRRCEARAARAHDDHVVGIAHGEPSVVGTGITGNLRIARAPAECRRGMPARTGGGIRTTPRLHACRGVVPFEDRSRRRARSEPSVWP